MNSTLIIVALAIIICLVVSCSRQFKHCPPDKIMIITGKVGRDQSGNPRKYICQHGGSKFIYPLIQKVHFLSLCPFSISIDLRGALSKENIRVNVPSQFTVGISTEKEVMPNAAERLLNLPFRNVESLAKEIIYGQMRLVIAQLDIDELNSKRDQFMNMIAENIETELKKVGLKLININITDITDEAGYLEAKANKFAAENIAEIVNKTAEINRDTGIAKAEAKFTSQLQNERESEIAKFKSDYSALIAELQAKTLSLEAKIANLEAKIAKFETQNKDNIADAKAETDDKQSYVTAAPLTAEFDNFKTDFGDAIKF